MSEILTVLHLEIANNNSNYFWDIMCQKEQMKKKRKLKSKQIPIWISFYYNQHLSSAFQLFAEKKTTGMQTNKQTTNKGESH